MDAGEFLVNGAGLIESELFNLIILSQPKVHAWIAGARIADTGRDVVVLHPAGGLQSDSRPDPVAVTFPSHSLDFQPMVPVLGHIAKDFRRSVLHRVD